MLIVEKILGKKPSLAPARSFREFEPERCCATCKFLHYHYHHYEKKAWQCARPNMEPFRVSEKNPRGCVCDGWYLYYAAQL